MSQRKIGIFDSGLGGLTVIKALLEQLPSASIIYFGDTARCPYGNKGAETVQRYSIENVSFLQSKGASYILVACNTATALALSTLQKTFSLPLFGVIDSAAEEACTRTKNGKIGIIGTTGTIASKSHERAIYALDPSIKVFGQACPLLVTLIEEGSPCEELTDRIIRKYVEPLLHAGIDTLLLGCTHYPLLEKEIANICGPNVTLINPASTASHLLVRALQHDTSLQDAPSGIDFYSSDDTERFRTKGQAFLGMPITQVSKAAPMDLVHA